MSLEISSLPTVGKVKCLRTFPAIFQTAMLTFVYVILIGLGVNGFGKSKIVWESGCTCPDEINLTGVKKNDDKPYNCGVMGAGVVQKISYRESFDPTRVSLSSACARCGLCVAIADKINETLMTLHTALSSDRWLNSAETEATLVDVCQRSFSRYRLRTIGDVRYIGDSVPGSTVVESTADGLWGQILQDKCDELLQTIGPRKLYERWRDWCSGLNASFRGILCHGAVGVLRDCRGVYTCL